MTEILISVIAVAAIVGNVVLMRRIHISQQREMARVEREHANERRDLLNRVMYLAGSPWEQPDAGIPEEIEDEIDLYYETMLPPEEELERPRPQQVI